MNQGKVVWLNSKSAFLPEDFDLLRDHGFDLVPVELERLEETAAARSLNIQDTWLVAHRLDDIETGNRAGCRTILINRGHETEWRLSGFRIPDYVAEDAAGACAVISGFLPLYYSRTFSPSFTTRMR
jgi:hypothetical protein